MSLSSRVSSQHFGVLVVVISSKAEAVVLFVVDEMVPVVEVSKFDEDVGEAVEEDVVAMDDVVVVVEVVEVVDVAPMKEAFLFPGESS